MPSSVMMRRTPIGSRPSLIPNTASSVEIRSWRTTRTSVIRISCLSRSGGRRAAPPRLALLAAQIAGEQQALVGPELISGQSGGDLTVRQHVPAVGHFQGQRDVLLDEQHRTAVVHGELADDRQQPLDNDR